jgi:PKD repeat protein
MTDNITTPKPAQPTEEVSFTTSPQGAAVSFTVGGDVYVSGANRTAIDTAITFTATDSVENPLRYEWDFGDGSKGYGNPVVHTYKINNPHLRAHLKVTGDDGKLYYSSQQIYLDDPT